MEISEGDLEKMGILKLGARRKIMRAVYSADRTTSIGGDVELQLGMSYMITAEFHHKICGIGALCHSLLVCYTRDSLGTWLR